MGEGNRAVAEPERQGKIFLWVPVLSPPQTHHHWGPESLGQGDGTDQIFHSAPSPVNKAHLIGPAHTEGNSSPKSCPEFSPWPASFTMGVGELQAGGGGGWGGHTYGTPFQIKEKSGLLKEGWCGQSWVTLGVGGWAWGQLRREL